jgi:hypothetical protein
MKNSKSPTRAQRRLYERYLKSNHSSQYREWKRDAQKRGAELHEEFTKATMDSIEEQMNILQSNAANTHKEFFQQGDEAAKAYAEKVVSSTKLWKEESTTRYKDL